MIREDGTAWRHDLGGGTPIALVQAGTFRSDAGAIFGPVPRLLWDHHVAEELDAQWRLLQALNCLLVGAPGGRTHGSPPPTPSPSSVACTRGGRVTRSRATTSSSRASR